MPRKKKPGAYTKQRELKNIRLQSMKNKGKIERIRSTEMKWEELVMDGRANQLLKFEPVHKLIYGAATRWGRTYKKDRITFEDFLSVFYQAAWEVITAYTWTTEFFLYEMIVKAIQSRGKNLLRDSLKTDRRRVLHEALPLADGFEEFYADKDALDVSEIVLDKLFKEQLLSDTHLTETERRIFWSIYNNENNEKASQRKVAKDMGIDRRIVSQNIQRLRRKLVPYRTA